MKVEVIEMFYDKDGVLHQIGDVIDIAEKERVEKLESRNLIKVAAVVEEKPSAKKTATRKK